MTTLQDCRALDAQDPLRTLRNQFVLPPGVIYLDGNSLGVMPVTAPARVAAAVTQEWGQDLIRSWNTAGWFALPQKLGNKIAPLIGAGPDEMLVCGMALGHADKSALVNTYFTPRVPAESFTRWVD